MWFKRFWPRGDAAFASPDLYRFCEKKRIIYLIRLPANNSLKKIILPRLDRSVGRPPEDGVQVMWSSSIIKLRNGMKPAGLSVGSKAMQVSSSRVSDSS